MKIEKQWKDFVSFAMNNFDSLLYQDGFGLCWAFAKHAGIPLNYRNCARFCCKRIARYRHKPYEDIPWKRDISESPEPRLRFLKYEAKRLGLTS